MDATPGGAPAELIVQNGRLKGSRRPLSPSLTVLGRGPGCDLRLNVDGVSAFHCVIVDGPTGLLLRDLHSTPGTLVNGQPIASCVLADGDVLTIGPFQFEVRLTGQLAAQLAETAARYMDEKDALRIQAAAVAAQQAALLEEEARLQTRQVALEQQEEQLSTHLEEKRRRLVELRDQTREAYAELRKERAAHQAAVVQGRQQLELLRKEAEDQRTQVQGERQRLRNLRRRMKQRWHRYWAAERARLHALEAGVGRQRAELEHQSERLNQERTALGQAKLAFNGEAELGRRRLQAEWDGFREAQDQDQDQLAQERADLDALATTLVERETALTEAERALVEDEQAWQTIRQGLEKEIEGLENRIRNYRRKIFDHQEEAKRLESQLAGLRGQADPTPAPKSATEGSLPAAPTVPNAAASPEFERALTVLETLTGEVADQRLHLVEQCQRLVLAQRRWQREHDGAAAELEVVGRRLQEREDAIIGREQDLDSVAARLKQQRQEASDLQRFLEGWQARMTAREAAWEGERDRLLTDLQAREKTVQDRLAAVDELRDRWTKRRRSEVEWLKGERSAEEKLRREWVTLRDDWLRRGAALEQEERTLAERALAMEQYQQEAAEQADDPPAAAKRLEKLRRRLANLSSAADRAVTEQRKLLEAEATRVENLHAQVQKHAHRLTDQEAELSEKLSAHEREQMRTKDEFEHLRQQAVVLESHRDRYEKQVGELRDEVERLARLLLDEAEPIRLAA